MACWRPSAGPTGASGRSDSGQTAAAPPEGVWCSCEALAWRHKIRCEKIPPFPESARAFTAALGAPRAAFPSSVACGTPPRVICVSVRGVGATARRAVDLHPALFSLLCRERVDGCGQSCSTAACVPQSTLAARGSVAQSARPASEVSAPAPGELTPRDLRHTVVSCVTCTTGLWGKDTREEVLLGADSGRALEISSRPRRPAPARPQATVVSRWRAERGSELRARLAAEQRTCQRPAAGQEERDEQRKWRGEPARARA